MTKHKKKIETYEDFKKALSKISSSNIELGLMYIRYFYITSQTSFNFAKNTAKKYLRRKLNLRPYKVLKDLTFLFRFEDDKCYAEAIFMIGKINSELLITKHEKSKRDKTVLNFSKEKKTKKNNIFRFIKRRKENA